MYRHNIEKDLKTVQIVSECILNFNYYNAHNLTFSNFWTRDFDVVIYVNIYFSLFKLSLQQTIIIDQTAAAPIILN